MQNFGGSIARLRAQRCRVPPTARSSAFRVCAGSESDLCKDLVNAPKDFQGKGDTFTVTFLGLEDQNVSCEVPDDRYILDIADENGIELPSTCRGGICGACVGRVVEGEVDMSDIDDLSFTVSEDEQADGMALLCMARPKSNVVIETQCDWGYSLGVGEWKGATGKFTATPEPLMGDKKNWENQEV